MADPWQNLVIKGGETKTITAPLGKLIDFLPCAGSNYVVSGKIDYGGGNVLPFGGNQMLTPPTMFVGLVTLTISVNKPPIVPNVPPPTFMVVTYRVLANV
jgi:hypothetical protein